MAMFWMAGAWRLSFSKKCPNLGHFCACVKRAEDVMRDDGLLHDGPRAETALSFDRFRPKAALTEEVTALT